ncbi:hypothetical protein RhiirA4_471776 [Rhizophagus irregularis]|uniref:Ion transport domain-containing protein n=1 Tax=Rhizophagus irregularis TaxID=588596 RepID=A0A2I1H3S0_9GLOM|nr:hypothetical protein RhiirA4_471776 [Rhizophagus irregularis]
MELETAAKKCENKDEPIKQQLYSDKFSVSRLHFCYTQGINIIDLFYMENGLRITSKKFDEIKQIYLLEFFNSDKKLFIIGECLKGKIVSIIWDIYNTAEYDGMIYSVLEKIENKLEGKNEKIGKEEKFISADEKMICTEPWMLDKYREIPYCLYHNKEGKRTETLQLIVGRSTVQIWHQINSDDENIDKDDLPNKGEPFLEYIWTNRIPIDQERKETGLRIETFENYVTSSGLHDTLNDKYDFHLKVYWYERESAKITEEEDKKLKEIEDNKNDTIKDSVKLKRKEKVIEKKDIIEKFRAIRHACRALEHLNKRYISNRLANNYIRIHKYEKIIGYIKHIIWKFAKHEPENFKLLYEKLDEFNKVFKGQKEDKTRYIPSNKLWPGKGFLIDDDLYFNEGNDKLKDNEKIVPENNMELAIYHCRGRELKDTIIIAYLLEYYSRHATDCAGWMCTVSKAIPLLFKYNYDDYARKLFFKECFANQDHFSVQDPNEIIPAEYLERRNHDIKFRAFRPMVNLKSNKIKWYDYIRNLLKIFNNYIIKSYENFDNDLGKSPLALRMVPLPNFTVNSFESKKREYNWINNIVNFFCHIFLPRLYQIKRHDRTKLSPFSRMILYENNDDIYYNPAIEAVINFHWNKARFFFFSLFLRLLVHIICFELISWAYLNNSTIINEKFLIGLIVMFYYLAIYLLITQIYQISNRGFRRYFSDVFNAFDTYSIILSVTIMTIMIKKFRFSDGFGSVTETDKIITGISITTFILWIELIIYFRLVNDFIITYIFYMVIILRTIFPFFIFMLTVVIALVHTKFLLLGNTGFTKNSTNLTLADESSIDFIPSNFFDTLTATWTSGELFQDGFSFLNFCAYTLVVLILTNMMIAFMGGAYEKAEIKGRKILLRYKANLIADYEALYHFHYWASEPEPKYIYYVGQSKILEEWLDSKKDQDAIYKDTEEKTTSTKFNFKEKDYDKHLILTYNEQNLEIGKVKNMKNDLNGIIEWLVNYHKVQKNEKEINIESIENMKLNDIKNILIDEELCPRCGKLDEDWEHIWICEANEMENEEAVKVREINFEFIRILEQPSTVLLGKNRYWELIREKERGIAKKDLKKSKVKLKENLPEDEEEGKKNKNNEKQTKMK